jgi:glycogen debranching enzyme
MLNSTSLRQKDWIPFFREADSFLEKTAEYVHLGINPGDYYKAIWTRDAAFILKDQFLTGDTYNVLRSLYFIWAHQIDLNDEKIIYGRGSPELEFTIQTADKGTKERFKGALPSTIYHNQGFSEVYARNPDIDSTALMVSTTSWILDAYLKAGLYSYYENLPEWASASSPPHPSSPPESAARPLSSADYKQQSSYLDNKSSALYELEKPPLKVISKPMELIEFLVPRMLAAINYLAGRDIDGDGLLEQGYNEDWMDTALRAGKIVYSQASWILAVSDFSSLLYEIGKKSTARRLMTMAERTVNAVEEKLWSEEDDAYVDLRYNEVDDKPDVVSNGSDNYNEQRMLTQDISLYLVSVTENTLNDILSMRFKSDNDDPRADEKKGQEKIRPRTPNKIIEQRAALTLEAIRNRIWMDSLWPLITETELKRTGPRPLDPNQYHNHTFWPWITGIEILARSRFRRYAECNELLSALTRTSHPQILAYYEWVNPITGKGGGAFPFRTGISTIRVALTDILLSHTL